MSRGRALITGAIGGLGTAMTKKLISQGIPVVGCDRKTDKFDGWRNRELDQHQSKLVALFPLDVTRVCGAPFPTSSSRIWRKTFQ